METKRRLVVGDIHGNYRAFMQALERANFNEFEDQLISLGDIVDGFPESARCVEFCRNLPDFIWVMGNHDEWYKKWLDSEGVWREPIWTGQGGNSTIQSYYSHLEGEFNFGMMREHKKFMDKMIPYYIDDENNLFVHAGIDWHFPIDEQPDETDFYWDRNTWYYWSLMHKGSDTEFPYKNVFIGHTSTYPENVKPVRRANLWNLDQGAGYKGRLTVMDVDTFEYWQSNDCDGFDNYRSSR